MTADANYGKHVGLPTKTHCGDLPSPLNRQPLMNRHPFATVLVLFVLIGSTWLQSSQRLRAQPTLPRRVETSGLELVTPETQKAIDTALTWMANRQHEDGSFGSGRQYQRNVAVTSLAGMAFLAAGHTPGRGKFGKNVELAVGFILKATKPNGLIDVSNSQSYGPMYGHGFATLFLAEVYGMCPCKAARLDLERAVKLIVNTQNKEGGWRYHPEPKEADISVTICQIMALRAARNCGMYVPKQTVDRCIDYVQRCQNRDGGFRYQLFQRDSKFPRSAAGVAALYSAGVYEGREIEAGLNYLMRFLPQNAVNRVEEHYFYGHYYAVQAMWQAGGKFWQKWYPAIRNELLVSRQVDGSWHDSISREYGTAMACIILQMPNSYLPIFNR